MSERIPDDGNITVRFDGKKLAIVSAEWIPDCDQPGNDLFSVILLQLRDNLLGCGAQIMVAYFRHEEKNLK